MISHLWSDHICYPLRLRRLQITRNRAAADGREGARSRCAELVGAAQLARLRLSEGKVVEGGKAAGGVGGSSAAPV